MKALGSDYIFFNEKAIKGYRQLQSMLDLATPAGSG